MKKIMIGRLVSQHGLDWLLWAGQVITPGPISCVGRDGSCDQPHGPGTADSLLEKVDLGLKS